MSEPDWAGAEDMLFERSAGVIRQFAKQVQNPETLSLLTLHTFVDALATSDKLWNGFKDSLLWCCAIFNSRAWNSSLNAT